MGEGGRDGTVAREGGEKGIRRCLIYPALRPQCERQFPSVRAIGRVRSLYPTSGESDALFLLTRARRFLVDPAGFGDILPGVDLAVGHSAQCPPHGRHGWVCGQGGVGGRLNLVSCASCCGRLPTRPKKPAEKRRREQGQAKCGSDGAMRCGRRSCNSDGRSSA